MARNYRDLRLKIGSLPPGWEGSSQDLISALETLARVPLEGNVTFGEGSVAPNSNMGPFLLDGKIWYVWDNESGMYVPQSFADKSIPNSALEGGGFNPGDIKHSASANPQDGWLFCDGKQYFIVDYPKLYDAIGDTYAREGDDDATKFRVPNVAGRVLVGAGTGIDGEGEPLEPRAVGDMLGEEEHTLTQKEMPIHNHDTRHEGTSGHTENCAQTLSGQVGSGEWWFARGGDRRLYLQCETRTAGGSQPHNNMQPSIVSRVLIKT